MAKGKVEVKKMACSSCGGTGFDMRVEGNLKPCPAGCKPPKKK